VIDPHNIILILGMGSTTQKYIEMLGNSNDSLVQIRIPKEPRICIQDITFLYFYIFLHKRTF
jgi:hypothetical protein